MEKNEASNGVPKKQKRQDLQGIRGIAIISVLGFHFFPKLFPNGYIGVDQFFVLSGFMMCMLLRKSYQSPQFSSIFKWIINFYVRRLKRIIPLYYLLIFASLVAMFCKFPYKAWDTSVISGGRAMIFQTNQNGLQYGTYFSMLARSTDIFTHTWSLSVEVQFYALIPFVYLIGAKLSKSQDMEILYHMVLGFLSLLFSKLFCNVEMEFYSVFARSWQFSVGVIAYLLMDFASPNNVENYQLLCEEEPKQKAQKKWMYYFPIFLIIAGLYPSDTLPESIFRPFITILTGITMVLPSYDSDPEPKNFISESRILTYFGDISYSLYLIHWPIYSYWKLALSKKETWNSELFMALGLSVLLAIFCYEIFEKWYLTKSDVFIFFLSLALVLLNCGLLFQDEIKDWISPPPFSTRLDGLTEGEIVSYEKAEKLNLQWSIHDLRDLYAPSCEYEDSYGIMGVCKHTGLDTVNGKYKLMLIGNSYAANHAQLFYQECAHQAHSIIQQSVASCEPLYPKCYLGTDYFSKRVEKEQPDYLFLVSRFVDLGGPMPPNVTSLDDDPTYRSMKKQLDILVKSVKYKIFMMHQIARKVGRYNACGGSMPKHVKENDHLVQFDKCLTADRGNMARQRYEKLAAECSKCELFDYGPYFLNKTTKTWRFYNEENSGLAYFNGMIHLTPHGLERIRPVIKDVCRKL